MGSIDWDGRQCVWVTGMMLQQQVLAVWCLIYAHGGETGPKSMKLGRISRLAWAQGISPSMLEAEMGPMQNLQSE